MVYWIVTKEEAEPERRFGPYESEGVAREALAELQDRLLAGTSLHWRIVCDFA